MPPKPTPILRGKPLRSGRPAPANPVVPGHAASLIICAPRPASEATKDDPADYRVLMVDRSARGQFGGLTVFPGGKVEPVDREPRFASSILANEAHRYPDSVLPHALAAIRETFEEVGLLLIRGRTAKTSEEGGGAHEDQRKWTREEVGKWRKSIHDDSSKFLNLCDETGSVPMTGALSYWANWITPEDAPKRFDVKFFLAVLLDSTDEVVRRIKERTSADGTEILGVRWVTPAEAMNQFNAGVINLIDPQFALLGELNTRYPRLSLLRPFFTPTNPRLRSSFELSPCMPEFAVLETGQGADESKGIIVSMTGDPSHSSSGDPANRLGGANVSLKSMHRCLLFLKNAEEVLTKGGQYQYQGMKYVRDLEWEREEIKKVKEVVEMELGGTGNKARI